MEHESYMAGLDYARKILTNLLPSQNAMSTAFWDYSALWLPRDIVGGDTYWMKQFDKGTLLCVCDCTGHGTSGALLSMLVVSTLEMIVRPHNCHNTAEIIWRLDMRLADVLGANADIFESSEQLEMHDIQDGCDLAVLFIKQEGSVTVSSGHINVFYCTGTEVERIRGQNIFVGEGKLKGKEDVKTVEIPAAHGNKFYIATDGLFDQPGGACGNIPFGYSRIKEIILANHGESQSAISGKIMEAFTKHRGQEPIVDDITLVTFKS